MVKLPAMPLAGPPRGRLGLRLLDRPVRHGTYALGCKSGPDREGVQPIEEFVIAMLVTGRARARVFLLFASACALNPSQRRPALRPLPAG